MYVVVVCTEGGQGWHLPQTMAQLSRKSLKVPFGDRKHTLKCPFGGQINKLNQEPNSTMILSPKQKKTLQGSPLWSQTRTKLS